MPYDEIAYQKIEEAIEEELEEEGDRRLGEKIRREEFSELKTRRHENLALVICFIISGIVFGLVLGSK